MKTKTIKTPLMTAERDALSYWPVTIVPESKLSHMATTHYGFVTKLSHHRGKTSRFALKKIFGLASDYGFYCFSSEDVFGCRATSDDGVACAGACSQAKAMASALKRKAQRHQQRGFSGFC